MKGEQRKNTYTLRKKLPLYQIPPLGHDIGMGPDRKVCFLIPSWVQALRYGSSLSARETQHIGLPRQAGQGEHTEVLTDLGWDAGEPVVAAVV